MTEYKYSKAEVIKEFQRRSREPHLFGGTAKVIVNIVKTSSRSKAIKKLKTLRKKYRNMSLSAYYKRAYKMLSKKL